MSNIIEQRRSLGRKIEKLIVKEFGCKTRPSFVLTFMLPDELTANYVANTSRTDGAKLLSETKLMIEGRGN